MPHFAPNFFDLEKREKEGKERSKEREVKREEEK